MTRCLPIYNTFSCLFLTVTSLYPHSLPFFFFHDPSTPEIYTLSLHDALPILASACLLLLEKYDSSEIINVGCGEDISIRELAELICEVVGFEGDLAWDVTKPDGTPRKLLDVSKLRALGWKPSIPLRDGIARTYEWFLANCAR